MRRDLLLFFGLAYAITWLGVSPLVAAHLGLIGPVPASLHGLGALGPVCAALLVARRGERRDLVVSTFGRCPDSPWLWVALFSPAALLGVAIAALAFFDPSALRWDRLLQAAAQPGWWINLGTASVLYGFGEEPGWRGFALPRLQRRLPAWSATLVLSLVWAVWHTPMFFYRFEFDGPATLVGFFVSMLSGAFWLTVLYNSSGGSVMAVALWHTLWNVMNLVAAAVSTPLVAVLNGLMMAVGFGVLLSGPGNLCIGGERTTPGPLGSAT